MTDIETLVLTSGLIKKKTWRISLHPEKLRIEGVSYYLTHEIPYDEIPYKVKINQLWPLPPVLSLKLVKKTVFNLKYSDAAAIKAWWPKGTRKEIKTMFKKRFWIGAIFGIIFILTSLLLPGDTQKGIEAIPLNPEGIALGISSIIFALFARLMPFRHLFLFDCLILLAASIENFSSVVKGEIHWAWLFLSWGLLSAGYFEFQQWIRFASLSELPNVFIPSDDSLPGSRNNSEN